MTDKKFRKLFLAAASYAKFSYFERPIGYLGSLSDAELYTLAGLLLAHASTPQAMVVARHALSVGYARHVGQARPSPAAALDEWEQYLAAADDGDGGAE